MTNIAMLNVCLLVGTVLRATKNAPDNAHVSINAFIIHVALPALILAQIHGLRMTPDLLLPVAMPWVLFTVGLFILIGRAMQFPAPFDTRSDLRGRWFGRSYRTAWLIGGLVGRNGVGRRFSISD
jgi:predicted permease